MKSIKVAYVSGASKKIDSVRGIGANNSELFLALNKYKSKNVEIEDTDTSNIESFDVVHFTVFRPFFISLPFFKPKNQKWVLTIHDLIQLVYPKVFKPGIKGSIRFLINKILIKLYIDEIVTISENSKKDICRFLHINPEKVTVLYISTKTAIRKLENGNWQNEIKEKFKLPDKFVLFDHGVGYNKNVPTLINACKKIKFPLAIVGKETENIGKLDLNHPELKHLKGVDFDNVLKLGYVTDEELNMLFNLATIYVQPSYYEGFGMPVIEAMKVGTPVIASRTQTLVEVAGEACLFFDPNSSDDLAEKINLMLKDKKLREEYIKKGYKQAKKYSWEKCAKETLSIYEKGI